MNHFLLSGFLLLGSITTINGQNLPDFRWENRILMVLTNQENAPELYRQLAEWENAWDELEERKLKVLIVTPWEAQSWDPQYPGEPEQSNWFDLYKRTRAPMEILLFGLDGGLKGIQKNFWINQDLFILIDQMPMRIREMQSEENKN